MFLTAEELAQASNRKHARAQLRWALDRGFISDPRMTDADGRPLVLRALFFGSEPSQPVKATPNWEAARG